MHLHSSSNLLYLLNQPFFNHKIILRWDEKGKERNGQESLFDVRQGGMKVS